MHSPWIAPGIRFDNYMFTEPMRLADWKPPECAGLFVILVRDSNWAPKPFQPLYFGEFGNNVHGALLPNDAVWKPLAGGNNLFVAVLPLPFSTTAQRLAVRSELLRAYNPRYQAESSTTSSEVTRKLDELERRHQEQTAQIGLLVASINRLFEPQPEVRRPIGFLLPPAQTSPAAIDSTY